MRWRLLALMMFAAAVLSGCGSAPKAATCPDDFALSLTLYPGPEDEASRALEPAWYVVEPDGILRAAMGERSPSSTLPPAVRRLHREQVEGVWRVLHERGWVSEEFRLGAASSDVGGTAAGRLAEVYIAVEGRRRSIDVPRATGDDAADLRTRETLEAVAAELRRLAWIE